jgi:hypothetical protein
MRECREYFLRPSVLDNKELRNVEGSPMLDDWDEHDELSSGRVDLPSSRLRCIGDFVKTTRLRGTRQCQIVVSVHVFRLRHRLQRP